MLVVSFIVSTCIETSFLIFHDVLLYRSILYFFLPFCPGQVSSTYERCCVLFNIGSLQSQIAKSQNFDSDEGIKNAAKHFQVSRDLLN